MPPNNLKSHADQLADALKLPDRTGIRALKITHQLKLLHCPHCGTANPTLPTVWIRKEVHLMADGRSGRMWSLSECTTCRSMISARSEPYDGKSMPYIETVFPAAWEAHNSIPQQVARFMKQAKQTLASTDASIVMSSSAIDAMLKDKGLTNGSLYKRIDQAVEEGFITKEMARWAHLVRLDANGSRHADLCCDGPPVDDAQRAFDYAETLADVIYVLPSRMPSKGTGYG